MAGEAPTTGTARIVTEDEHHYLEFDAAFSTSNMESDLHVLLEPTDRPLQPYSSLGSETNLGKLHSFSGVQRFPILDVVDLAISLLCIWCRMANATLGYALLNPASSSSIQ